MGSVDHWYSNFSFLIAPFLLLKGYTVLKKKKRIIAFFGLGFSLPIIVLVAYGTITSTLFPMIEQTVVYAVAINKSIAYAVPLSHFYRFYDPSLYDFFGSPGTNLILYEYFLPIAAIVGVGFVLTGGISRNPLKIILVGSVLVQSILLLFVHSVFIQYLLPVSWLWALFSAVAIVRLIQGLQQSKIIQTSFVILVLMAVSIVGRDSVHANTLRSKTQKGNLESWLPFAWRQIPEHSSVYPNIVFRPIAYPMVFGYYLHDTPQSIKAKLPPLIHTLEKNNVAYIQKTYEWIAMPKEFPAYVEKNFNSIDDVLYKRKTPLPQGSSL